MPQIGEKQSAKKLGFKETGLCIWYACEVCGKERWVRFRNGKLLSRRCKACANIGNKFSEARKAGRRGKNNWSWSGGRHLDNQGYVKLNKCLCDEFFYPMVRKGNNILEHRYIMAKHLGRCLLSWEIVHHKNGIKNDNRIENLELLAQGKFHLMDTHAKARIKILEKKVAKLEKYIEDHNIIVNQGDYWKRKYWI